GETQRDRASGHVADDDGEDEDEDEDEDDRRAPPPKKGLGKLPVIAGAVVVVGLIVGLIFKRIHDAKVTEEKVTEFTGAASAKPPARDIRKAVKLGRDLPDDAKRRPDVAQSLARLETDLKALEAREAALAVLTAVPKTATPDERIAATKTAMEKDEHCVQ